MEEFVRLSLTTQTLLCHQILFLKDSGKMYDYITDRVAAVVPVCYIFMSDLPKPI